ncbi:Heat shock protein 68 [Eumeta japonica]|uniref:Heat shock protein 68 n=1 Tax=Eumeta variegata TaxID=151549 RepID=A0A4C1SM24_EUMVA|nr:Heat shock protein 68 [Eumeta japonica]
MKLWRMALLFSCNFSGDKSSAIQDVLLVDVAPLSQASKQLVATAWSTKVDVTFDLDANGILNVTAKEMSTGNAKNIVIKNDKGRLSQAEIDRMVNEAERWLDNTTAEKEEYEYKLEELTKLCQPIMTKLHQQANGNAAGAGYGQSAGNGGGPTVEEVD